jgi:disease resistance protein RPM1
LLDPLPDSLSTPSTQTQAREDVPDGEIERLMEVLTQEQEQCTLEKQHGMTDGVQDVQIGRSIKVVVQEHGTLEKQHDIEKEFLDPLPELLSIPSTQTQAVTKMQNRELKRSAAVVSASHGALGPLLEKLNALLAEEHGNLKGVCHEVHFLRSELTLMHAAMTDYNFLGDPGAQVKVCISLLREFSYDAEDCIDRFIYQLGNDGHHGGFKEFFRKTARQLKTLGSRHEITEKILGLNARVKEMGNRMHRYKLDFDPSKSYNSTVDPPLYALYSEKAHLVGIDGPRDDLAKWMVEVGNSSAKHCCRVLSIVGFGGLGKTTLANEVYRKINGQFHCQAFVSVSQKPNIKNIFTKLISQVSSHGLKEDINNWDERRLIAKLRELLQNKR